MSVKSQHSSQAEKTVTSEWAVTLGLPVAALLAAICFLEPMQISFGLLGVACYIFFQKIPDWLCATPRGGHKAKQSSDKMGFPLCTASISAGTNALRSVEALALDHPSSHCSALNHKDGSAAQQVSITSSVERRPTIMQIGRVAALMKAKEEQREEQRKAQQQHSMSFREVAEATGPVSPESVQIRAGRVAQLLAHKQRRKISDDATVLVPHNASKDIVTGGGRVARNLNLESKGRTLPSRECATEPLDDSMTASPFESDAVEVPPGLDLLPSTANDLCLESEQQHDMPLIPFQEVGAPPGLSLLLPVVEDADEETSELQVLGQCRPLPGLEDLGQLPVCGFEDAWQCNEDLPPGLGMPFLPPPGLTLLTDEDVTLLSAGRRFQF